MSQHHKIAVASEMLLEAHRRYSAAAHDIDYIVSILLSGAVVGIVGPLLKEQGARTMHELLAEVGKIVAPPNSDPMHEGMFRAVYNALKHSGNKRIDLKASDDLEIHTELRMEAIAMLDAAVEDFRKIKVAPEVRAALPAEFTDFLSGYESYA